MDYNTRPFFYGTGRRKSSIARVRLYQGTGKVTINGRDIDDYFGLETLKRIVRQPLALTDLSEKFDIECRVVLSAGKNSCLRPGAGVPRSWLHLRKAVIRLSMVNIWLTSISRQCWFMVITM